MSANLSGLTIGSLTLTPAFDKNVVSYTATTTNSNNKVTATAEDSKATISIKNGDTEVVNGEAATWADGENVLTVKVVNGTASKTYTVTVTKSGG